MEKQDSSCGHRLLKSYLWGFLLSLALASLAFWIANEGVLSGPALYGALGGLLLLQVLVQVLFFLKLNASTESGRWNLIVLGFTLLIVLIVVTGSLWIMYNLNYYMVH